MHIWTANDKMPVSFLQYAGPQCPIDPDWVLYQNNCYFFSGGLSGSERAQGFMDANQYCMNKGGYLVSVHSTNENEFLRSMVRDLFLFRTLFCERVVNIP